MYLYIGIYELVDAVGMIIVGHFSINGELQKEHYTRKHHNKARLNGTNNRSDTISHTLCLQLWVKTRGD